jgi:L-asparaginase II
VLALLGKLGLDDRALQCGTPYPIDPDETALLRSGQKDRSPLQCDCSGKHSGMLASCLQLGYPIENYLEPAHPLQQTIRGLIAEVCRVSSDSIKLGTDGCSLPTFGLPLSGMARSFATLAAPEGAPTGAGREHATALNRLRAAMTAHPENVGGHHDRLDTDLMRLSGGKLVAKSGAEGLLCVGVPAHGVGIALRIGDGSFRAHGVIIAQVLNDLGLVEPEVVQALLELDDPRLFNHNRRHVGDIRAAFELTRN